MTGRDAGTDGRTPGWRVRIIVDGRADAAAVGRHLERFGCRVVELRPRGLLIELPNASDRDDAESEARLYLAMWHARHPHDDGEPRVTPVPDDPGLRPRIRGLDPGRAPGSATSA